MNKYRTECGWRKIIEKIVNRKNWIGHILRGDGLLKDVIEGRMEVKRTRRRRIA